MDNTQKPNSPPTFDPVSPPAPPPPVTAPPWPPTPTSTFPSANPIQPDYTSANLSSGWPPAPEPAPPPPVSLDASLGGPVSLDASLGGPVSPLGGPVSLDASLGGLPPPPAPPPPPTPSPLDNPWGAPAQPPPINTPSTPPPWTPPASPIETSESPPTDLSHLVGNNPQPEPASTNLNQAETLVVPSTIVPETSTEHLENGKKGMPKWLIGGGVGLLIAVLGASAYFIMGIGQTPKTTSLPAVDTSQTTQIKPPAPLPTPVSEKETSSFGELQGGGQQATSAGDLLRQGQQQGR